MKRMILSVDVDNFPGSETGIERILELLDERGIRATFFIAGKFAKDYKSQVKEIHNKGYEIGCHGYSHGIDMEENFVDIDLDEQNKKIEKATSAIKDAINDDVRIFRAPYAKANSDTIKALENQGYLCDSSVTALRFDFGLGVGNNVKAFFAPSRPYHPSRHNIFKRGGSSVLEVPISAFVVPLTLSAIRSFSTKRVCNLFNISSHFFDPVVFYLHPWEVLGNEEIKLWQGLPRRHKKNRGEKALKELGTFIDYVSSKAEFIQYVDVAGVE